MRKYLPLIIRTEALAIKEGLRIYAISVVEDFRIWKEGIGFRACEAIAKDAARNGGHNWKPFGTLISHTPSRVTITFEFGAAFVFFPFSLPELRVPNPDPDKLTATINRAYFHGQHIGEAVSKAFPEAAWVQPT